MNVLRVRVPERVLRLGAASVVIGQCVRAVEQLRRAVRREEHCLPPSGGEVRRVGLASHRREALVAAPDPFRLRAAERGPPVVGPHLDVGDPALARVPRMQAHPVREEEPAVGDVAQERVMEAVAPVDRIQVLPVREPRQREPGARIAAGEEGRVGGSERLPDHGAVREQRAIGDLQLVQTRAEGALEGQWELARRIARPRELDDEQGIAGGSLDRAVVLAARARRERARRLGLERPEIDEEPVAARPDAGGLGELRTGRRDHEDRLAREAEPIDEPDDLGRGPVQVFDPEGHRTLRRQSAEESPPRVQDLVGALVLPDAGE